ncbi:hypothetical protein HDE_10567 [Halotydeus destructor]|nr:hypothetical protein HDE_10567 [Halotydeus destructor]
MDAVIKVATGLGRARIEEAFYDSRIRMNGEKVSKKSENVTEGDEIDIILGRSFNNNELLDIARVIIRNVPDIANNKGRSNIEVRHFKKLIIENYPDPYEGTIINTPKERSN